MRGKQFHKGMEVYVWAIVVFCQLKHCPEDKLRNFVVQLRKIGNDAGMPIRRDPCFVRWLQGMDTVEPVFRQLRQENPDLQLVMIILPGKTPIYGKCDICLWVNIVCVYTSVYLCELLSTFLYSSAYLCPVVRSVCTGVLWSTIV